MNQVEGFVIIGNGYAVCNLKSSFGVFLAGQLDGWFRDVYPGVLDGRFQSVHDVKEPPGSTSHVKHLDSGKQHPRQENLF